MDNFILDIKAMLAEGENANVEFKECGKAFPKEFWPTYSAFANTRGGWIILASKNIEIESCRTSSKLSA